MSWLDKPQPQAGPAEQALLGGLLMDPGYLPRVLQVIGASDFYRPEHAELFKLLERMHRFSEPIDLVSVADNIVRGEGPQRYGGAGYVAELPERCPATANLEHYARLVFEASVRRRVIRIALGVVDRAFDGTDEPGELVTQAMKDLAEAGVRSTTTRHMFSAEEVVDELLEEYLDGDVGAVAPPLDTALPALNELLYRGGLCGGQLILVGGATKMGKTAAAMSLLVTHHTGQGVPVGYVSIEMPRRDMVRRGITAGSGLPLEALGSGDLDDDEREIVRQWGREHRSLFLSDRARPTMAFIADEARRMRATAGLRMLVIDHLHLVKHEKAHRNELPNVYIGRTADQCKELARELDIPVVLLVQLGRGFTRRDAPKRKRPDSGSRPWWEAVPLPRFDDFKDSSSIEQAADLALFPITAAGYARAGYKLDDPPTDQAAIVIGLQRNGTPEGVVGCRWEGDRTRFVPYGA